MELCPCVLRDGMEDSKSRYFGSGISSSGSQPGERRVAGGRRRGFSREEELLETERRGAAGGPARPRIPQALGSVLSQLGLKATGGRSLSEEGTASGAALPPPTPESAKDNKCSEQTEMVSWSPGLAPAPRIMAFTRDSALRGSVCEDRRDASLTAP